MKIGLKKKHEKQGKPGQMNKQWQRKRRKENQTKKEKKMKKILKIDLKKEELRKEEKSKKDIYILDTSPSDCHHYCYPSPLGDPIIAIDQPTRSCWVDACVHYPLTNIGFDEEEETLSLVKFRQACPFSLTQFGP